MMNTTKSKIDEFEISAIVIRADGRVEDLGVISKSKKKNIFLRLFGRVIKWLT